MSRRRSPHCNSNGNPKTCLDGKGGFKLFGVRLSTDCCMPASSPGTTSESSPTSDLAMRKSVSMGNLCSYGGPEGRASSLSASQLEQHDLVAPDEGYASDDLVHTNSSSHERKKGVPWTEEEHRSFLSGLQALGKGDWRGISRNFVMTRTPTQVASHAQKYFLRRNNLNKRRRRSSLFDITPDSVSSLLEKPVSEEAACEDPDVSAELSLGQSIPHGPSNTLKASRLAGRGHTSGYLPVPVPYPLVPVPLATSDLIRVPGKPLERQAVEATGNTVLRQSAEVDIMEVVPELVVVDGNINIAQSEIVTQHEALWPRGHFFAPSKPEPMDAEFEIVKPVPIIPSSLQKADEMPKISEPNTNMARRIMDPTPLSFELLGKGSRHSAFHVTFQNNGSRDVDGQGSLNSAISVP